MSPILNVFLCFFGLTSAVELRGSSGRNPLAATATASTNALATIGAVLDEVTAFTGHELECTGWTRHGLKCVEAACNEIGVNGGNALLSKGKSLGNTGTLMLPGNGSSLKNAVCANTYNRRRPNAVGARPLDASSVDTNLPKYCPGPGTGITPRVCVRLGFKKKMCETAKDGSKSCGIKAVGENGITVICNRHRTAACAEDETCPKAIKRDEMLARANVWLAYPIAYSQGRYHTETQSSRFKNEPNSYRSDCSGFVAMAWKLEMCAVTTYDLLNQTPRGKSAKRVGYHRIKCGALKKGDALVTDTRSGLTGHVVLFDKWVNEAAREKEFWALDQTFSEYRGTVRRRWSMARISDLFKTTKDTNLNVKCGRRSTGKACTGTGKKGCKITATHAIQSKDASSYGVRLAPFFCIRRNNLMSATGALEVTPKSELWDKTEASNIAETRCFSKHAEEEQRKLAEEQRAKKEEEQRKLAEKQRAKKEEEERAEKLDDEDSDDGDDDEELTSAGVPSQRTEEEDTES